MKVRARKKRGLLNYEKKEKGQILLDSVDLVFLQTRIGTDSEYNNQMARDLDYTIIYKRSGVT